jgi:ADP-heptose:LPS heptosyltransferase
MGPVKKILFYRLGAVGDVLLTTPAVKKAKELFPDARIHYMTEYKAAPVLRENPYIDKIIELRQVKNPLPREFAIFFIAGFLKEQFSGEKYDYFFDLESSYYSTYISFFIKAVKKYGFKINQKKRKFYNKFYDCRLDYSAPNIYMAKKYLALVKAAVDFKDADTSPVLVVTPQERAQAGEFYKKNGVKSGDKKILLGISGTWDAKKWPDKNWIELARGISAGVKNAKIFVLWGPNDPKELPEALEKIDGVKVIPEMGLRELITVISGGDILIANDGAPRHIGQALGLKTIGLFGPTNDRGWVNPDDKNIALTAATDCRPCDKIKCDKKDCMKLITPEKVMREMLHMIE